MKIPKFIAMHRLQKEWTLEEAESTYAEFTKIARELKGIGLSTKQIWEQRHFFGNSGPCDYRNRPVATFYIKRKEALSDEEDQRIKSLDCLKGYDLRTYFLDEFGARNPYLYGVDIDRNLGVALFITESLPEQKGVRIR